MASNTSPPIPLWRLATGPAPGPCQPECLRWSEDNLLAMACENTLRVLAAGERTISWKLSSERMAQLSAEAMAPWKQGKKRGRPSKADAAGAPPSSSSSSRQSHSAAALAACPLQTTVQPIVACNWSPLGAAPASGCLLVAAVGHSCGIFVKPSEAMQLHLESCHQFAPLLHTALGHDLGSPTPAQLDAVRVHASSWSPLMPSTTTQDDAAASLVCFLALGGPSHLTLFASPAGGRLSDMKWTHALSLPQPKRGATAVSFAPLPPDAPSGRLDLLNGHVDGSVTLWRLATTTGVEQQQQQQQQCLEVRASRKVKVAPPLQRLIGSLSVVLTPLDAAAADFGYLVMIGFGPFAELHRVRLSAMADDSSAAEGGGGSSAAEVGCLQTRVQHESAVTCVLCVGRQWYSASHDGSILTGPLLEPPAEAAAATTTTTPAHAPEEEADDGDDGDPPQPTQPSHPQPHPPIEYPRHVRAIEYPSFDQLADDSPHAITSTAVGKGLNLQPQPSGSASTMKLQPEAQSDRTTAHRMVFGLAAAPCGGALALSLRSHFMDGRDSTRLVTRPDNWRLCIASPPPGEAPPPAESHADLPSTIAQLTTSRPLGCSVWAAGMALLAQAELGDCARAIEAFANAAVQQLGAGSITPSREAVAAVQTARALACELQERPWAKRQVAPPNPAHYGARTASSVTPQAYPPVAWGGGHLQTLARVADKCATALLRKQAASVAPPAAAEACPLCTQPTRGEPATLHCKCANGHELSRCWRSLRLLPLDAWICATCGAGSCYPTAPDGGGLLGRSAPPGICGLCGSPCTAP